MIEAGEVSEPGALSCFSGTEGGGEDSNDGSAGNLGGFRPLMSIRGFAGARARDPDVALEAALPGRFGATSLDRGALSESSESESELSEEV